MSLRGKWHQAGGTIVKHLGTVKDTVKNPGKTLKKIGEGTVKKAKKAFSTVKGWFSWNGG
ncbi:hypothetical protein [Rossellomorea marisflavi]|uniref:hypothetical protein n=1 Tax=Rossellomorea marisflavi TaxID=189381 RepID=UPI00345A1A45